MTPRSDASLRLLACKGLQVAAWSGTHYSATHPRRTLTRSAAHASRLALAALLRSSAVLPDAVLETARALERGRVERDQFRVGE